MAGRALLCALLLGLVLAKLWLARDLPLFGDEAFYWLESRQFAWAHDDVPALVPWLIRSGVALVGPVEWAVRLPFALLALATLWLIAHMAVALGKPGDGWIAATLALLLPLFAINGLLALPDVPLTLAVLLCVEGLRRLLLGERLAAGVLAVGIALGWLSHYRFAVPFGAAGLWLLAHPVGRQLLRTPRLWLGGLIGSTLGLAPLLWHQLSNAGGGFAFQFVDRHPWRFQPEALIDPVLQALVATPLLFALLLAAAWTASRELRRPDRALVGGVALSILGCYLLLGPFVDTERSRLHWPLPALLIATALAPAALAHAGLWARRIWAAGIGLASAAVGAALVLLAILASAPQRLADGDAYLHGFTGWREAGREAQGALQALPVDTLLVADHFALAAALAFDLPEQPRVFSLDSPINRKHGRQGELARMGLDERALGVAAGGRPLLLVLEESATSLRQRPAWFRRVCEVFPGARPHFERSIDHGRKRLIGYFQAASAQSGCSPPAVGYLSKPEAGAVLQGMLDIEGWALRDAVGLAAINVWMGGRALGRIDHLRLSPDLLTLFPGSDDPRHPHVGFGGQLVSDLPAGHYWLEIEAEGYDGVRSIIATAPVNWRPPADQGNR